MKTLKLIVAASLIFAFGSTAFAKRYGHKTKTVTVYKQYPTVNHNRNVRHYRPTTIRTVRYYRPAPRRVVRTYGPSYRPLPRYNEYRQYKLKRRPQWNCKRNGTCNGKRFQTYRR